MGTVLNFDTAPRARRSRVAEASCEPATGELVIFPGVRIERQAVDLSARLRDTAGMIRPRPDNTKTRY
ncbi:MAG: hypothetical protein KDJ16_01940 [Hyphomicrobiales bacterium]|nr:hypothetical protein [Hyphomicrobiales bacterium]